MWATGVVVGSIDVVVPNLPIAVKSTITMTIPPHSLSAEQPGTALVLVAYGKGVVEPVLDVLIPQEGALVIDVDVAKTSRVHDRLDRVGLVEEHDLASVGSIIVPALVEGFNDGRRRVSAVGAGLDDARVLSRDLRCGLREDEGQLERRGGKSLAHRERHDEEEGLAAVTHLVLPVRGSRCFYIGENRELRQRIHRPRVRYVVTGEAVPGVWGIRLWGSPR